ncbi:MAG: KTSC domain-containing protein, partial [Zoogloeaceae bacterium]|nr:KTSC domain-containing protein [Zoogloeaceae bacterium]
MEIKRVSSGKLRGIGYDAQSQCLLVQFDDGTALEYDGVGAEIWRRLSTASSPWSIYRDNVEEEYAGRRVTVTGASGSP